MSLVSSKTTDIYLAQGVALAGRGDAAAAVLRFPPTFPLARVLALLKEKVPELLTSGKHVRVRLSPALCFLLRFEVPDGVRSWKELEAVALARAAAAMDIPPAQLVVGLDASRPGWAAAISKAVKQAVENWCEQERLVLASLAPLWSEASQCELVNQAAVEGCVVREPDGINSLDGGHAGTHDHVTLVFQPEPVGAPSTGAPAFLRAHWQVT